MAKILLADDNVDIALMMAETLEMEEHEVTVVYSGQQIVDKLEAGNVYDVIITDLIMPQIDGLGILRYLEDKGDKTPVMVLSGGGVTINSDDALKSVEGMACCVLKKPFKHAELMKKINEQLCS